MLFVTKISEIPKLIRFVAILLLIFKMEVNAQPQSSRAEIKVDLEASKGPIEPIWAWFGYDEPNYTYMKDGKKLLTEIAELSPVPVYVRTHSLMVTGNGEAALKWGSTNMYTEDAYGNPLYDWKLVDSIFDTYVQRGLKPLVQIGFMPKALSVKPEPYRHHWKPGYPYSDIITGWAYPPKDYDKWRELVYQWAKHCLERYGKKEVETWYWEVWNEPNGAYWKGSREEFFKLYDYAADGLRKALPTARIGGINVAGTRGKDATEWTRKFIEHCISGSNYATGQVGSPLDAVLFHAKGEPRIVRGVVQMNASPQLQDIEAGMKIAASYPQTKDLPLIVGESDPEGCAACGMATNPQNAYRNGLMYPSYTAATIARIYQLASVYKVNLVGAVNWSFEFENQPWFFGYRDLATNGVDKPILNLFRMLGKMTGNKVEATSSRMYPLKTFVDSSARGLLSDIGVMASKDKYTAGVLVWNYHDNNEPRASQKVSVLIDNIPAGIVKFTHYRIDDEHSNSYEVWKKMGSPRHPSASQISALEKAGQLTSLVQGKKINLKSGKLSYEFDLPHAAVSFLKLDW
ncbi:GH39 family glycosyl hydrolase [Pedobacter agri]|uniref:GH39 family glycosyl hydrolase n=1 Tax=Pedobacter agri TaxID=454586 RepID=UPI00292EE190|nr:beta-xylosidase [Pedobacter agri]